MRQTHRVGVWHTGSKENAGRKGDEYLVGKDSEEN